MKMKKATIYLALVSTIIIFDIQSSLAYSVYYYTGNQISDGSYITASVTFNENVTSNYNGPADWNVIAWSITLNNSPVLGAAVEASSLAGDWTFFRFTLTDGEITSWELKTFEQTNPTLETSTGYGFNTGNNLEQWSGYQEDFVHIWDHGNMVYYAGNSNPGAWAITDNPTSGGDTTDTALVPEPSTLLLLGAGLAGLVGLRRFKR